ncbi:zinc uptake regulation protein [Candidatus Blochmanniella floridana]|uniref:Zinc uptake regulation protein n=1 Tax=Blochmanniella floridana TaxID=203907 RepID=Q7VQT9_BLOFL|nr:zinc uptake regulation protein [Candidatus Blochmannia floridanus]
MNLHTHKLLIQTKKICAQRQVRLTPQRIEVLKLISKQYQKAVSAYDLLHLSRTSSLPHAKPSTIYRALNFLLKQGFIHRIESTNKFMLCQNFLELSHNFIFFICNHCKQVTEQAIKEIEIILQHKAKLTGFNIHNNIIESHGLCLQCTNKLIFSHPLYK